MIMRLCVAAALLCLPVFGTGELRFVLHHEPKTLNPLAAGDDAAETLRYLTSGVLIRVNRLTQEVEPDLAQSWTVSADNRSITFELRSGLVFSDGTRFTPTDVVSTVARVVDPALRSPVADTFTVGGVVPKVAVNGPNKITFTFGAPVSGMERLFDELAIVSSQSPRASLGPFVLDSYKPGVELLLKRNHNYWKKDAAGKQLPYLETVRIPIQANREIELNRFRAGELDLMNSLDPESFDRLAKEMPGVVQDSGPSTDVEFLWFNLAPGSTAPQYKKDWFQSAAFRHAVSTAINREDLSRVVYRGHARPAVGPFSPANKFWFNSKLAARKFDPSGALKLLESSGFQKKGGALYDRAGHAVEFSLITNAGNKSRERMAALIQQDLQGIGIKLNIVTLDFPSLLERLTKSSDYESCLFGLTNVAADPNELMNVLLSSGRQHAWNPSQKTPATAWEAEMDALLRAQAAAGSRAKRKDLFDRVQELMQREEPYLYLVNRNSLSAISRRVQGAKPAAYYPQTFWNVERLSVK